MSIENMKIFALQLKKAREKNGYTQKDAADSLGVGVLTYRNYEALGVGHCEPSQEMILKMAELFNVEIDYLFGKR